MLQSDRISDHFTVSADLNVEGHIQNNQKYVNCRNCIVLYCNINSIDIDDFKNDILHSELILVVDPCTNPDDYYDEIVQDRLTQVINALCRWRAFNQILHRKRAGCLSECPLPSLQPIFLMDKITAIRSATEEGKVRLSLYLICHQLSIPLTMPYFWTDCTSGSVFPVWHLLVLYLHNFFWEFPKVQC